MNTDETQTECGQIPPSDSLNRSHQIDVVLEARLSQLNQAVSRLESHLYACDYRLQLLKMGEAIGLGGAYRPEHLKIIQILESFQDDHAKLTQMCQAVGIELYTVLSWLYRTDSYQQKQP